MALVNNQSYADAVQYILIEAQRHPGDSLVDIANEAFEEHDLPFDASWDDDIEPIIVEVTNR